MPKDTKNFKVSEFTCHCCGGGANTVSQVLMDLCQTIRDKVGVPLRVNSGYRCEKHNAEVGGVKAKYDKNGNLIKEGSKHLYGLAADLSGSCGAEAIFRAVKELYANNQLFHMHLGYAIWYHKKNFVHVDVGAKRKSGNVFEERK